MSTSSGMNKLAAERNQRLLLELVSKPGNDVCADCKSRNPRWASYNLGIFICVGCASIHRKIGTHVSKVKSLTLDSWTKEQVDRMKEMGNIKSNAIYNPNEVRHPPPPRLDDPTRDNDLEQYIRSKYEYRRFMDKNALVASKLGPSRSASSVAPRANSTPPTQPVVKPAPPPQEPKTATDIAATMFSTAKPQLQPRTTLSQPTQVAPNAPPTRSVSQPVSPQNASQVTPAATKPEGVWADLISLQEPSANASLPLQYQAGPAYSGLPMSNATPPGFSGLGANPFGNVTSPTTTGLSAANPSLSPFPQQSQATNPFAQQSFSSQTSLSPFPTPASTPFNSNSPQIPSSFNQSNTPFQSQVQSPTTSIPFHQPQPQPPSLVPSQSQPQFLSPSPNPQFLSSSPNPQFLSSSPNPQFLSSSPNTQFLTSHSPQLQLTAPNPSPQNSTLQPGFNSSVGAGVGISGVGYMTPSPQPFLNGMHGPTQGPVTGMQSPASGFGQPQQTMAMHNSFGQMQFAQGGFPGQAQGTQWGPL